ncbi:MAG TPA: hypothetical protein VF590_08500 [Isosphaeraceae bacterium]
MSALLIGLTLGTISRIIAALPFVDAARLLVNRVKAASRKRAAGEL